jgi:hypothetical protein
MSGFGDAKHGEADQSKGEKKDTYNVVGKVAPGGKPSPSVEERRKDDEEYPIGV